MAETSNHLLQVFLCHASSDKPAARALYKRLIVDGIDAWLDEEKLLPGQNWKKEIQKAIRHSNIVVILLSEASVSKSGFVQKEIKLALDFAEEKPEGTIFLIPIRLENCAVPESLSDLHCVDMFYDGGNLDEGGYSKLAKSLKLQADNIGLEFNPADRVKLPLKDISASTYDKSQKAPPLFSRDANKYEQAQYALRASSRTPALIVYLIDISGSMANLYSDGKTRLSYAQAFLQSSLTEMVQRSMARGRVMPRYRIAMFAYSDDVYDIYGGVKTIDEVVQRGIPQLNTHSKTENAKAFRAIEEFLQKQLPSIQNDPAPLVFHVSDSDVTEYITNESPLPAIQRIMNMSVKDGNVLVTNIFASLNTSFPLPPSTEWKGFTNPKEIDSPNANVLFEMSSTIPISYQRILKETGYNLSPKAKMLFPLEYAKDLGNGFVMSQIE